MNINSNEIMLLRRKNNNNLRAGETVSTTVTNPEAPVSNPENSMRALDAVAQNNIAFQAVKIPNKIGNKLKPMLTALLLGIGGMTLTTSCEPEPDIEVIEIPSKNPTQITVTQSIDFSWLETLIGQYFAGNQEIMQDLLDELQDIKSQLATNAEQQAARDQQLYDVLLQILDQSVAIYDQQVANGAKLDSIDAATLDLVEQLAALREAQQLSDLQEQQRDEKLFGTISLILTRTEEGNAKLAEINAKIEENGLTVSEALDLALDYLKNIDKNVQDIETIVTNIDKSLEEFRNGNAEALGQIVKEIQTAREENAQHADDQAQRDSVLMEKVIEVIGAVGENTDKVSVVDKSVQELIDEVVALRDSQEISAAEEAARDEKLYTKLLVLINTTKEGNALMSTISAQIDSHAITFGQAVDKMLDYLKNIDQNVQDIENIVTNIDKSLTEFKNGNMAALAQIVTEIQTVRAENAQHADDQAQRDSVLMEKVVEVIDAVGKNTDKVSVVDKSVQELIDEVVALRDSQELSAAEEAARDEKLYTKLLVLINTTAEGNALMSTISAQIDSHAMTFGQAVDKMLDFLKNIDQNVQDIEANTEKILSELQAFHADYLAGRKAIGDALGKLIEQGIINKEAMKTLNENVIIVKDNIKDINKTTTDLLEEVQDPARFNKLIATLDNMSASQKAMFEMLHIDINDLKETASKDIHKAITIVTGAIKNFQSQELAQDKVEAEQLDQISQKLDVVQKFPEIITQGLENATDKLSEEMKNNTTNVTNSINVVQQQLDTVIKKLEDIAVQFGKFAKESMGYNKAMLSTQNALLKEVIGMNRDINVLIALQKDNNANVAKLKSMIPTIITQLNTLIETTNKQLTMNDLKTISEDAYNKFTALIEEYNFDNLPGDVQTIKDYVSAFEKHIVNVDNNTTHIAKLLETWPIVGEFPGLTSEELDAALGRLTVALDKDKNDITAELKEVQQQLSKLQKSIDNMAANIAKYTKISTDYQVKFDRYFQSALKKMGHYEYLMNSILSAQNNASVSIANVEAAMKEVLAGLKALVAASENQLTFADLKELNAEAYANLNALLEAYNIDNIAGDVQTIKDYVSIIEGKMGQDVDNSEALGTITKQLSILINYAALDRSDLEAAIEKVVAAIDSNADDLSAEIQALKNAVCSKIDGLAGQLGAIVDLIKNLDSNHGTNPDYSAQIQEIKNFLASLNEEVLKNNQLMQKIYDRIAEFEHNCNCGKSDESIKGDLDDILG